MTASEMGKLGAAARTRNTTRAMGAQGRESQRQSKAEEKTTQRDNFNSTKRQVNSLNHQHTMKDYSRAISTAIAQGVDFRRDFFAQNVGGLCAELAQEFGYRKPKNANGSTGRYFFARMQRQYYKDRT